MKGRGFNESKNTKTKQYKTKNSLTPENAGCHRQNKTPGGFKFAQLVAYPLYSERTSTSTLALGYPLLRPSRYNRAYYCMPSTLRSNISTYHPPVMLSQQHSALYNSTDSFLRKRFDRKLCTFFVGGMFQVQISTAPRKLTTNSYCCTIN